jgi:hypothetical protein
MSSRVSREFDAASATTLRNANDGAETADVAEAGVPLDILKNAYWDNNNQPYGISSVSLHVSNMDRVTLDETYTFIVEVDTSNAFASAVEVGRINAATKVGFYQIPFDNETMELLEPGATHIRIRLDVAGTTPSVVYGAWLTFLGV